MEVVTYYQVVLLASLMDQTLPVLQVQSDDPKKNPDPQYLESTTMIIIILFYERKEKLHLNCNFRKHKYTYCSSKMIVDNGIPNT